jgi:hypothetical protein
MTAIDIVTVRLTWAENLSMQRSPYLLRGAIAERFADNSLFHQHEGGRLAYRYPSIHYRWDQHGAAVVGFGVGVRALMDLSWPGLRLDIGGQQVSVLEATCSLRRSTIVPAGRLLRYRFEAPWLPFPVDLYQRYRRMTAEEQEKERDRLAVANLLMAMRGLGVTFPERLFAAVEVHRPHTCAYKGVELLGFTGTLLANVDLPTGFAIGRAVSHGYGWLSRTSAPLSPEQEERPT